MPHSNVEMIRKLQIALNSKGLKVLCNRSQFFSEVQNRPVTMYKVAQSYMTSTGRTSHKTLFESASQIQVVLFMRNLWYAVNGIPIPETNQMKGAERFMAVWKAFEESGLEDFLELSNTHANTHEEDI